MARPLKSSVDYFPHYCTHGETMFILDEQYGIHGYYFWFRLLELLGQKEGHYIDCNNKPSWRYLNSHTKTNPDQCREILDLLAELGAIDEELWAENIIWSENFVQGIKDAYRHRKDDVPQKPSFQRQKQQEAIVSNVGNSDNDENLEQSHPENEQIKLNEIKLDEIKLKDICTQPEPVASPPSKKSKIIKPSKIPLPQNFSISEQVEIWAKNKGYDRLAEHLEAFIEVSLARAYIYADWDSAFKKAIREDWAKLRIGGNGNKNGINRGNITTGNAELEAKYGNRENVELIDTG
jgi:hypothetical protein